MIYPVPSDLRVDSGISRDLCPLSSLRGEPMVGILHSACSIEDKGLDATPASSLPVAKAALRLL